jgi:hypothetical protein
MSRSSQAARAQQNTQAPRRELYAYEVRREGRIVAKLSAHGAADGSVVVETEVFPASQPGTSVPRPFEFPDADYARHFVDEAILALEYLGCEVAD